MNFNRQTFEAHRGVILLVVLAVASVTFGVAHHIVSTRAPATSDVPGIIARSEGVDPTDVDVLVYAVKRGQPFVLYRLLNGQIGRVRDPEIAKSQTNRLAELTHPGYHPWNWMEGGGRSVALPWGGGSVSVGLLSANGDIGSAINTEIYGATRPDVAEVQLTVNGQRYAQQVGPSGGYLFLMPDKGVTPGNITDMRILDHDGQELPTPIGVGGPLPAAIVPVQFRHSLPAS